MSLFASRRNTRTEERVLVMELQELLDAREVPKDPIRRAKFWADWNAELAAAEKERARSAAGVIKTGPSQQVERDQGYPRSVAASSVQPSLFPDLEDAA